MKQYEVEVTRTYRVFVEAESVDEAIYEAEMNVDELSHGIADSMESHVLGDTDSCKTTDTPAKAEWFGIVRWCEDDIRAALVDKGFEDDEEAVDLIRFHMENGGFTGCQIEAGWDYINAIIWNEEDNLKRKEVF